MANSNTTLASLWVDDGQGSPIKLSAPSAPSKVTASDEFIKYYKEHGLDSFAKEVIQQACLQRQKKCHKWREKIARDPELEAAQKEKDKARVQHYRAKPKTPEEPVDFRHRFEM